MSERKHLCVCLKDFYPQKEINFISNHSNRDYSSWAVWSIAENSNTGPMDPVNFDKKDDKTLNFIKNFLQNKNLEVVENPKNIRNLLPYSGRYLPERYICGPQEIALMTPAFLDLLETKVPTQICKEDLALFQCETLRSILLKQTQGVLEDPLTDCQRDLALMKKRVDLLVEGASFFLKIQFVRGKLVPDLLPRSRDMAYLFKSSGAITIASLRLGTFEYSEIKSVNFLSEQKKAVISLEEFLDPADIYLLFLAFSAFQATVTIKLSPTTQLSKVDYDLMLIFLQKNPIVQKLICSGPDQIKQLPEQIKDVLARNQWLDRFKTQHTFEEDYWKTAAQFSLNEFYNNQTWLSSPSAQSIKTLHAAMGRRWLQSFLYELKTDQLHRKIKLGPRYFDLYLDSDNEVGAYYQDLIDYLQDPDNSFPVRCVEMLYVAPYEEKLRQLIDCFNQRLCITQIFISGFLSNSKAPIKFLSALKKQANQKQWCVPIYLTGWQSRRVLKKRLSATYADLFHCIQGNYSKRNVAKLNFNLQWVRRGVSSQGKEKVCQLKDSKDSADNLYYLDLDQETPKLMTALRLEVSVQQDLQQNTQIQQSTQIQHTTQISHAVIHSDDLPVPGTIGINPSKPEECEFAKFFEQKQFHACDRSWCRDNYKFYTDEYYVVEKKREESEEIDSNRVNIASLSNTKVPYAHAYWLTWLGGFDYHHQDQYRIHRITPEAIQILWECREDLSDGLVLEDQEWLASMDLFILVVDSERLLCHQTEAAITASHPLRIDRLFQPKRVEEGGGDYAQFLNSTHRSEEDAKQLEEDAKQLFEIIHPLSAEESQARQVLLKKALRLSDEAVVYPQTTEANCYRSNTDQFDSTYMPQELEPVFKN